MQKLQIIFISNQRLGKGEILLIQFIGRNIITSNEIERR